MSDQFFEKPILNSPYEYPVRHWQLDDSGQPTQKIVETRRQADFITPIPKPKLKKGTANQQAIVFDEGHGLSTEKQEYAQAQLINSVRAQVDQWRKIRDQSHWGVTPETARLLDYWRNHPFQGIRPFFC